MQDLAFLWSLGSWELGCAIGDAGGSWMRETRHFGETSIRNRPGAIVYLDRCTADLSEFLSIVADGFDYCRNPAL